MAAGMRFMGPDKRAKELRQAANRLHWEVSLAVGDSEAKGHLGKREVSNCLYDLAEAMAIIAAVTEILDETFPPGSSERDQFKFHLNFFRNYHRIPR